MTLSRMAGGSDQATILQFRATALINPLLNELPVLSAGDFHAIAKMEEDVFHGPFGQTHFRFSIADCRFLACPIWQHRYEGISPFPQRGHRFAS